VLSLSGGPLETLRFRVLVPDDTVSSVEVTQKVDSPYGMEYCGRGQRYFVTTADTCEYRGGSPRLSAAALRARMPEDTSLYRVKIDLRNPERLAEARSYSEQIGQPLLPTDDSGFFIISVPREDIDPLRWDGFSPVLLDSLPPLPEVPAELKMKERRVSPKPRHKPRPRPSGKLDTDCAVYVNCVDGEDEWGRIYTNQLITIYLSFWNGTGHVIVGVDNGFRIYSNSGVEWDTTMTELTGPLDWDISFPIISQLYAAGLTGSGADSVRYLGYGMGTGLPNGYDDSAIAFTIGPIDESFGGEYIYLDSSWVSGGANWSWSDSTYPHTPDWYSQPYSFEIRDAGDVYIWGMVRYFDPTPPYGTAEPARNVYMWVVDADPGDDDTLAVIKTDDWGYYSVGPIDRDDLFGPDIYFIINAENDATIVTSSANDTCRVYSPVWPDMPPGDFEWYLDISQSLSGPFFVADAEYSGYLKWIDDGPGDSLMKVQTILDDYENSSYSGTFIRIDSSGDWLDTWNEAVILHEYGHHVASKCDYPTLGFFLQGGGGHSYRQCYDIGLPESEGWAHFFSAWVRNTPLAVNYESGFTDSTWKNIENGEYHIKYSSGSQYGSVNAMGLCGVDGSNEGAFAGMLWDIYDTNDDDYSDSLDWGTLNMGPNPDGRGNALSMGVDEILDVLVNDDRRVDCSEPGGCRHPQDLHDFWHSWFRTGPYPNMSRNSLSMVDIWYEHGVPDTLSCCVGIRGDVDGDGSAVPNIVDLNYMVAYMYQGGPPPPCDAGPPLGFVEADIDANGGMVPNINDLVVLVSFMFQSGPDLQPCLQYD